MEKTKRKINKIWLPAAGVLAAAAFWRLLDVRSGAVNSGDGWLLGWYLLLCVLAVGLVLALGWAIFKGKDGRGWDLCRVYPLAGLGLGLLYLFVLPPMSAPDEIAHYVSAYEVSDHLMGKRANSDDGYVLVRAQDWFLEDMYGNYVYDDASSYWRWTDERTASGTEIVNEDDDKETSIVLGQTLQERTYRAIHGVLIERKRTPQQEWLEAAGSDITEAESIYPPVNTTPAAYLPQALGITLARLLGLGSLPLAYLGRLFNLLFFVGMTWLAMRRLPFGKEVLFGVALLPMTLHLSASFSYDVMILGCMFLFTAACLDLAYARDRVRLGDAALLAVLMAAAGPCKMIYAPLMGLCLLVPVKKFGGWGRWLLYAAMVAGAWALAMALVNGQIVAGYATGTGAAAAGLDTGYSFSQLLRDPVLVIRMFGDTLAWQGAMYMQTMLGTWLGNLDQLLNVPYPALLFFAAALLLLALRKPGEELPVRMGSRVWIWTVCALCGAAAMFSMLLA